MLLHTWLFISCAVVHIHDVFWWYLPFSLFFRFKTFMTFHGYEGAEIPSRKAIFWHRLAAALTSGNLCIGQFHQKWYGVTPTKVSFGAVEQSLLYSQPNQEQIKKSKSPITTIIFVGRLAHDTGILTYLHGLKLLIDSAQSNKKYMLDVFGNGPLAAQAKEYAQKYDLPVTFHGFVENAAEKIKEYQLAFISRHLAILEALAQRVPVVAHYNNQIKEDYLRVSPFETWIDIVHSPEDVAAAVHEPKQISDEAFEWVRNQTWQKMIQDYFDLWAKT
jgi:glycosyltransferase involved in cell wall biosynthesis